MRELGVGAPRTILACAIAAAALLACTNDEAEAPQEYEVASDATVCSVRNAGDPWWIASYGALTGRFHSEFRATPSANNIDAVVGWSKGVATTWTKLAAIVRFSPTGVIDVRKGGAYAADVSYPYYAGQSYLFRVDIDVTAHTYSVYVRQYVDGPVTTLARNYPFRTEQASVTSLDGAAVYLEPSRPGSLEICDWLVAFRDDSTPDGCVTSTAGGTFQNALFPGPQDAMVARVTATPSTNGMDGVVGFTLDPADAYNDFAVSVRFWTNGQIEARDGDVYRASSAMSYVAGRPYTFWFIVDFRTSTYSVFAMSYADYENAVLIADGFRFRPQQVGIPFVHNVATIVASSAGQVKACGYRTTSTQELRGIRTGTYRLGRFADGRALISSSNGTQIVGADGRTQLTHPAVMHQIATDTAGNVYNAVVSETNWTTLTLQSFTSALQPRWTASYPVEHGAQSINSYGNGVLGVVVDMGRTIVNIREADGTELSRIDLRAYEPMAVAVGPGRYAFAWRSGNDGIVEMHAADGTKVWERRWTGNFSVAALVMDEGGGLVFGGSFGEGGIDFGAGWYEPFYSSEVLLNGYIVSLHSNGALRFARRHFSDGPYSLSAAGSMVAYATTQWTQVPHPQLFIYDIGGGIHHDGNLALVDDEGGYVGQVLVGSDGRVLLNTTLRFHPSGSVPPLAVLAQFTFP